jgi:hypothetical protein
MTRADTHRCPRCSERDLEIRRLRSALLEIQAALATTHGRRLRSYVERSIQEGLAKPTRRRP